MGMGKPSTVRYEAVNAMLLNEFLKDSLAKWRNWKRMPQTAAKAN